MTETNQTSREQLRKGGFSEPVLLSGEVIKTFSQDQRRLLLNLAGLVENERMLKGKDGLELERVRYDITVNLNRAIDSGLGYLSLIQRHCQNFDVTL